MAVPRSWGYECALCHLPYYLPRILPCLHTFCSPCLSKFVLIDDGFDDDYLPYNPCPQCYTHIERIRPPLSQLPENNLIQKVITWTRTDRLTRPPLDLLTPPLYSQRNNIDDAMRTNAVKVEFDHSIGAFGVSPDTDVYMHLRGLAVSPVSSHFAVVDSFMKCIWVYSSHRERNGDPLLIFYPIFDVIFSYKNTLLVTVMTIRFNFDLVEYQLNGDIVRFFNLNFGGCILHGIAACKNGDVVLTGLKGCKIMLLTPDGQTYRHKMALNVLDPGHPAFLRQPFYLTVNSKQRIIVSDSGSHCLKIFSSEGEHLINIGRRGHGLMEMVYPQGVCVDESDNVFVADAGNYRIQVFSKSWVFLSAPIIRTYTLGPDARPINVAVKKRILFLTLEGFEFTRVNIYRLTTPNDKNATLLRSLCCWCWPDPVTEKPPEKQQDKLCSAKRLPP